MTFPSATQPADTPRRPGGSSGAGATTWIIDYAAERMSVIFNQPVPAPNLGRRKTD